jgi:hypothetical protein
VCSQSLSASGCDSGRFGAVLYPRCTRTPPCETEQSASDGVTVALVETLDHFAASDHVIVEAFGMGPEAREEMEQR